MTEFEHDWAAPATVMPPMMPPRINLDRAGVRQRNRLEAKLDEMKVSTKASNYRVGPGYMVAIDELLAWLDNEA